jgi:glycosyltransferase involved in cell wall biosynthesis
LSEHPSGLPGVTVVIPVYNVERYVERSLRSALQQTYPALAVLLVDDGSSDGSLEICRRLADASPNVKLVSGPNRGVAAARNRGTELARTEYVAYLDADDLWHPEKIARQVEAFARRGADDWAACYCLYRRIDDDDRLIRSGPHSNERGAFFAAHLKRNHVGNGSSLLVRRDAALEVGGFDPSHVAHGLGGCEDFDFQLKLLRRYKIDLIAEYLVGYREREDQMSADRTRMGNAYFAVVDKFAADPALSPSEREEALVTGRGCAAANYFMGGDIPRFARAAAANLRAAPLVSLNRAARFAAWQVRERTRLAWRRRSAAAPSPDFYSLDPRRRIPEC